MLQCFSQFTNIVIYLNDANAVRLLSKNLINNIAIGDILFSFFIIKDATVNTFSLLLILFNFFATSFNEK